MNKIMLTSSSSSSSSSSFLMKFFILLLCSSILGVFGVSEYHLLEENHPLYGIAQLVDSVERNSSSSICYEELKIFKNAVDEAEVWSLKVLESSGQPTEGFLFGNNLWIGSHKECIEISNKKPFEIQMEKTKHKETPFDYPPYDLKFLVILLQHNNTIQYSVRLPLDYMIQLGLCIPKSCLQEEIFFLAEEYFANNSLAIQKTQQFGISVLRIRELEENFLWLFKLPKTIIFLLVIGIIILFNIIGTVLDVGRHKKNKNIIRGLKNGMIREKKSDHLKQYNLELNNSSNINNSSQESIYFKIFKSFSIYTNIKKWSYTKASEDSVPILNGLRLISMLWVIIVHAAYYEADFFKNSTYLFRLSEPFLGQIVANGTFCVDTFLFISGFLLSYLFLKNNPYEKPETPIKCVKKFFFMLLNRFLRLSPTYYIITYFSIICYTYYSKTSSLYFNERSEEICDKFWWRNLLYINNLYPRSEMCLSWSWYLSLDMQLFIFGAFILLLSTLYFKIAAAISVLVLLIQVTINTYLSYSINYIPTLDNTPEYANYFYDLPWNRAGSYIVGMAAAYLLVIKLKNQLILKERTRLILWTIFPLLNIWPLFSTYFIQHFSVEYAAFYMGISRTSWAVGIGWFVIAVSTGNAQVLKKVMSFSGWVPLARLTYCAYLLNPLIISILALEAETPIEVTVPEMALAASGAVFLTMLVAFEFCILFESPFIFLTKLLLNKPIYVDAAKIHNNKTSQEVEENNERIISSSNSTSTTSIA